MKASSKIIFGILAALLILTTLSGFTQIHVTGLNVVRDNVLSDPAPASPTRSDSKNSTVETSRSSLLDFVSSITDGEANTIRGIYSEGVFQYPVIQQPATQPAFVSETDDVVTEFNMPRKYGVTGILAHNYLAGDAFFALENGDLIHVVYGDGSIQAYEIVNVQEYQALSPDSPNSSFLDMSSGEKLTATQLFKKVYMGGPHLTLQTCIQVGNEDSWGRLFLIAEPVV